jgi:hypothetical protein
MKAIKFILFSILMMAGQFLQAQDNDRMPKIEEMHNQKWQFLVSKAQLTPEDVAKVQLVFMSYEKSIWDLHQQNREFFKASMKDAKKVKPNYAELNDRYVDFEFKEAQLFKNYHMQLRKLLSPETLFNYYRAEREFKRKLLQDFQGRRPPERPRPQ